MQVGCHSCIKCANSSQPFQCMHWKGWEELARQLVCCVRLSVCVCLARQGITQLGLLFMQMGAGSFSVAIVDLLTAAMRWPGVALVVAVDVAGVSVVRMLALTVLVTRCPDCLDIYQVPRH